MKTLKNDAHNIVESMNDDQLEKFVNENKRKVSKEIMEKILDEYKNEKSDWSNRSMHCHLLNCTTRKPKSQTISGKLSARMSEGRRWAGLSGSGAQTKANLYIKRLYETGELDSTSFSSDTMIFEHAFNAVNLWNNGII